MSRKTNRLRRNRDPIKRAVAQIQGGALGQTQHAEAKLLLGEHELAPKIGMSVHWLRKDRLHSRTVPFIRIGAAIRYHLPTVQRVLLSRMEGGSVPIPNNQKRLDSGTPSSL